MNLAGTKKVRKVENEQYDQEISNLYSNLERQTLNVTPGDIEPCGQRVIIKAGKVVSPILLGGHSRWKVFDFLEVFKISKELAASSINFAVGDRIGAMLFINQTHFPIIVEETEDLDVAYYALSQAEIIAVFEPAEKWQARKPLFIEERRRKHSPILQGLPSQGEIIIP